MGPAVLIGFGQALVFPSTLALVSKSMDDGRLGAGMGLVGALRNAGKVAGPVLAGLLIVWLDFAGTFRLMGGALLLASLSLAAAIYVSKATRRDMRPRVAGELRSLLP